MERPTAAEAVLAEETAMAAVAASAVVFLAGIWLVFAPLAFDYRGTGGGFQAYWNEIIVGAAIALVALVRITSPIRTAAFSLVNVVMGVWLIISPFVLGYTDVGGATGAVWNNIIVGVIVTIAAGMSAMMGMRAAQHLH